MDLQYTVTYSQRKSLTITVERDRSVVIMAPIGTSPEKIRDVVESRKLWIYEKLQHPQKYDPAPRKEFVSGETVLYLGRNYRLEIQKGTEESIRFQGKFVVTGVSSNRAATLFREWYITKARKRSSRGETACKQPWGGSQQDHGVGTEIPLGFMHPQR